MGWILYEVSYTLRNTFQKYWSRGKTININSLAMDSRPSTFVFPISLTALSINVNLPNRVVVCLCFCSLLLPGKFFSLSACVNPIHL